MHVLGAFAAVRLALLKKTKERVVFKIFEIKDLIKKDRRKSILSEIEILKNSSHPNIIKLLSCLATDEQIILIFEYNCSISIDFAIKLQKN
jgi:serine/threonine protein kinase